MSFMCKNKKSLIRHTIQMSHYLTASIKPSYMAYLSRLIENSDLPRDAHSECSLCIRAEVTVTRRIASHRIASVTYRDARASVYIYMQCSVHIVSALRSRLSAYLLYYFRDDATLCHSQVLMLHCMAPEPMRGVMPEY